MFIQYTIGYTLRYTVRKLREGRKKTIVTWPFSQSDVRTSCGYSLQSDVLGDRALARSRLCAHGRHGRECARKVCPGAAVAPLCIQSGPPLAPFLLPPSHDTHPISPPVLTVAIVVMHWPRSEEQGRLRCRLIDFGSAVPLLQVPAANILGCFVTWIPPLSPHVATPVYSVVTHRFCLCNLVHRQTRHETCGEI